MTLNIWNYTRPWPVRRGQIAALILEHRPDVVALQETRHDWRFERGRGQGDQLASLTGYHATFGLGQVYIPVFRVDEGVTILTVQPPLEVSRRQLTMYLKERDDQNQRVCLHETIEYQGRHVHIFDTHFSLSERARISNAREVRAFVEESAGNDPAIVMGDLNALPHAESIQVLTGDGGNAPASFVDAWTAVHANSDGFTYASFNPTHRIDYVLCRNVATVQSIHTIGHESADGVHPSDHLGLVADLEL